ncbi:fluoride efflux transporter CrcB [Thalassovita mediterranea]|jgi:CrcB protein|uniref:Fluoride-specific ion channel FluC n=1 Tax=Thalassovita mediterranea TaxID=340021 RepID=A0A0N7M1Y3_9RHOB|nr:fluoride efflux transporter CrcB [Thalassovita mediterranea]MCG7573905.1 fluoride efflux transporter CrcB [Phaeobacter sp. CNT1-3]CUH84587.1 camphor resistance protein CrcB [Thalassovita mediterranea]SIS32217.1 camphor resistance protein CrcB [Thalassovita mediterranea]
MFITALHVALGGAVGAVLRYLSGVAIFKLVGAGFPLGVLFVNVLGSGLMGMAVVFLGQRGLSHLNPVLMTGVLGGFTTFSAFSLEAYTLFERGQMGWAALYVGVSVICSLAALVLGVYAMRWVLA